MGYTLETIFRGIGNLLRWWIVITPWEQAVRVRLGKKVALLTAGVHLRIPGADRIFRQSTRQRYSSVPTQTISTLDGKTVTLSAVLGYSITDIRKLYDTLHHAEDTLQSMAMSAVARFLRTNPLHAIDPTELEDFVVKHLDISQFGLQATDFCVTDFAVVRTYRLIQGAPREYSMGSSLHTETDD